MLGDWFVKALIVQYLLAACAYAGQSSGWKALYFVSAAGIAVAMLRMR